MQSWLSHFAMVLEFRRDGDAPRDLWVLERGDQGINYFLSFPTSLIGTDSDAVMDRCCTVTTDSYRGITYLDAKERRQTNVNRLYDDWKLIL
jgi:hypothetical protein